MSMYVISTSLKIQQQQHFKINLSSLCYFCLTSTHHQTAAVSSGQECTVPLLQERLHVKCSSINSFWWLKSLSEKMNICPLNLFLCQISATLHVCASTPSVVDIPAYDIQTQHQPNNNIFKQSSLLLHSEIHITVMTLFPLSSSPQLAVPSVLQPPSSHLTL